MSIMDKSIASRIALLLGLFCLVLCAFLISLLQCNAPDSFVYNAV